MIEYISVRGTSQFTQVIGKRDLAAPIFASALREFIKRPRPRRCVSNLLRCDCGRCGERRFWWPWHCLRMDPQHSKPRLRTGRSRYFLTPMVTGVKGVKPIQKTWHVKSLDIMEEMSKILPEQCTSITPKKESTCQFQSLLPTSQIIIYNQYYIRIRIHIL